MELVLVDLDAGTRLNATECSEIAGAELGGGTDLCSGRDKRMECGRDGRATLAGSMNEWTWLVGTAAAAEEDRVLDVVLPGQR